MAIPLLGALVGIGAGLVKKGIGKLAGKVIGSVGGRISQSAGTAVVVAGGAKVASRVIRPGVARVIGGVAAAGAAQAVIEGVARRIRRDGKPYKRPTMNPCNPRALRRSIRRLEKFGEFAKSMGYSRPPRQISGFKGLPKRKRAQKCR